jgi:hypothetical protein
MVASLNVRCWSYPLRVLAQPALDVFHGDDLGFGGNLADGAVRGVLLAHARLAAFGADGFNQVRAGGP